METPATFTLQLSCCVETTTLNLSPLLPQPVSLEPSLACLGP